jgi:hypothetical protein
VRTLRCLDQFLSLAFAQLTYRESLRDVCVCLEALGGKRYHMGLHAPVKRSTLADANERRDWRIFRDFAEFVIAPTRPLYANEPLDLALQESVYALDAPLIRLCRSVFPWATYRQTTVGIKLHTVLDLRSALPTIVRVSPGRDNDMTFLKQIVPEPGAIYVMDRGHMDFAGLCRFTQAQALFPRARQAQSDLRGPAPPPPIRSGHPRRSHHRIHRARQRVGVSAHGPRDSLRRSGDGERVPRSHQQLSAARPYDCRSLSPTRAD